MTPIFPELLRSNFRCGRMAPLPGLTWLDAPLPPMVHPRRCHFCATFQSGSHTTVPDF